MMNTVLWRLVEGGTWLNDVCTLVLHSWESVSVSVIQNGFRKAEILESSRNPADWPINNSSSSSDSNDEKNVHTRVPVLTSEISALFNSDMEDENFEGYTDDYIWWDFFYYMPIFYCNQIKPLNIGLCIAYVFPPYSIVMVYILGGEGQYDQY